jgi:hypothetical protein
MTNLRLNDDEPGAPAADRAGGMSGQKRFALAGLALIGVIAAGVYLLADRDTAAATEVLQEVPEIPSLTESRVRSGAAPAVQATAPGTGTAAEPVCLGPSPGPTFSCHPDGWRLGPPPVAAPTGSGGSGRTDRSAGCVTEMPGPSFVCQNGLWTIAGGAGSPAPGNPVVDAPRPGESACGLPAPGTGWVCENNTWVMPPSPVPDVPVMPTSSPVTPASPEPSAEPSAPETIQPSATPQTTQGP